MVSTCRWAPSSVLHVTNMCRCVCGRVCILCHIHTDGDCAIYTHVYLSPLCREIPMTSDELQFLIEKILRCVFEIRVDAVSCPFSTSSSSPFSFAPCLPSLLSLPSSPPLFSSSPPPLLPLLPSLPSPKDDAVTEPLRAPSSRLSAAGPLHKGPQDTSAGGDPNPIQPA